MQHRANHHCDSGPIDSTGVGAWGRVPKHTWRGITLTAVVAVLTGVGSSNATEDIPPEAKGYQESGYDLSQYEHVNLANGNLTFNVPLTTLTTEGGSSYDLALYYNSKLWAHRQVRWQGVPGLQTGVAIADGIPSYGVGWDMRPPRLQTDMNCVNYHDNPCADGPSLRRPLAWVDQSGGKHYLYKDPPWDIQSRPHWQDHLCEFGHGAACYSRDGSNLKAVPLGFTHPDGTYEVESVTVWDGTGAVYYHSHRLDESYSNDYSTTFPNPAIDADLDDFEEDISGIYLTSYARPWQDANSKSGGPPTWGGSGFIAFHYRLDHPWLLDHVCTATEYESVANPDNPVADCKQKVAFSYGGGLGYPTLNQVHIPEFDPTLGADSYSLEPTATIQLSYHGALESFGRDIHSKPQVQEHNYVDAPFLFSVQYPDGPSFEFFRDVYNPLSPYDFGVVLPTGGTVEYYFQPYPIAEENVRRMPMPLTSPDKSETEAGGEDTYCAENRSSGWSTMGLQMRVKSYRDASGNRQETTWFKQVFNCSSTWPYDFSYALESGLNFKEHYLFTLVSTWEGYGFSDIANNVEIHRFDKDTYDEFSTDSFDSMNQQEYLTIFRSSGDLWGQELFRGEEPGAPRLAVLRHVETERDYLYRAAPPGPPNYDRAADRGRYVKQVRTYTNEEGPASPGDLGDVCDCYPSDGAGITCGNLKDSRWLDNYHNLTHQTLETENWPPETAVERMWRNEYEVATGSWFFRANVLDEVCDGFGLHPTTGLPECDGPDSSRSITRRKWGDRARLWPCANCKPYREFVNPNPEYPYTLVCGDDCIMHDYSYDSVGNLTEDWVGGGYGTGWGSSSVTTAYTYNHGRPVEKKLVASDGDELLLWKREVDPNTGLARWHLDGSGVGSAYLYDDIRRITDIAPVEWDPFDQGIKIQTTQLPSETSSTLLGIHIDYTPAAQQSLFTNTASSADYTVAPGYLLQTAQSSTSSAVYGFDGLGRLTRTEEAIPTSTGRRERITLSYLHDWEGRMRQTSEWRQAGWPLVFTTTWHDGIGRPTRTQRPDSTETTRAYVGDGTVRTTTGVVQGPDFEEHDVTNTSVTDALGRLRRLIEDEGGLDYTATYTYDEEDQLASVDLDGQDRLFTYSNAGFLLSLDEPERRTDHLGYNGLGSIVETRVRATAVAHGNGETLFELDKFGRLASTSYRSNTTEKVELQDISSYTYGDATASPLERGYGKLESTVQHNSLATPYTYIEDIHVTTGYSYNGPGGRIDEREVAIFNPDNHRVGFDLSYQYDRDGNLARLHYPDFYVKEGAKAEESLLQHVDYDYMYGTSWLTSATTSISTTPLATIEYSPSGRRHNTVFYGGLATLTEQPDSYLPRPRSFSLTTSSGDSWYEGDYGYDSSGNVWEISGSKRFVYDGTGRIKEYHTRNDAEKGGWALTRSYDYDRYGNLTALGALSLTVDEYNGETNNRLCEASALKNEGVTGCGTNPPIVTGPRGNIHEFEITSEPDTHKLFYHSMEDRLLATKDMTSQTVTRYLYDHSGERVAWLRYDSAGELAEEKYFARDEAGRLVMDKLDLPTGNVFKQYVPTDRGILAEHANGETYFHATDHLGSTRVLFNDKFWQELDYYPFGRISDGSSTPDTTVLFTGHERDLGSTSSELDYMHARYYGPRIGRFVSVDPVGGEVGSSQSWNRYSYALNNPIVWVDPRGQDEESPLDDLSIRKLQKYQKAKLQQFSNGEISGEELDQALILSEAAINQKLSQDEAEAERPITENAPDGGTGNVTVKQASMELEITVHGARRTLLISRPVAKSMLTAECNEWTPEQASMGVVNRTLSEPVLAPSTGFYESQTTPITYKATCSVTYLGND